MINIHIDTTLLAVPGEGCASPSALEDVLGRLVWLSDKLVEAPKSLTVASDASARLLEAGQYPEAHEIEDWIALSGLTGVYDAKVAWTLLHSFLVRVQTVSDVFGLEVFDCAVLSSDPLISMQDLEPALKSNSERALATSAALTLALAERLPVLCSGVVSAVGLRNVQCRLDALYNECGAPIHLGQEIEASVLCVDRDHGVDSLDAEKVWQSAKSPRMIHLALYIKARSLLAANGHDPNLQKFFVGTEFFQSLCDHQCSGALPFATLTLSTCAQVLIGRPKYSVDPFGKIRVSDGAIAMRTQITKGNPALRLMYWARSDGIEFSNVGPKKELVIERGDHLKAITEEYFL